MKLIRRILIGTGTFVVAFMAMYVMINMKNKTVNYQSDSWQQQLPVAYLTVGEKRINPMFAHLQPLPPVLTDADLFVTGQQAEVPMQVQLNQAEVKEIRFKLYDMQNNAKEIEYSVVGESREEGGLLSFLVRPKHALTEGQSYLLELGLEDGRLGRTLYYYSRLEKRTDLVVEDYLTYVERFFTSTINGSSLSELSNQITYQNTATPYYCDMTTGETAILWGRRQPKLLQSPIPRLIQAGARSISVVQGYRVMDQAEEVRADEVYRMNAADGKIQLLAYERSMNRGGISAAGISGGSITLETAETRPQFAAARDRRSFAIIEGDSLWSYRADEGELNLVYGPGSRQTGRDGAAKDQAIRIQQIDDDGSITFFVGGYMHSSLLEGKTGIAVYRYDQTAHVTKQIGFIDINEAGALIADQMKDFTYLNEQQELFFVLEGNLYQAKMAEGTLFSLQGQDWQPVTEILPPGKLTDYRVSGSGRQFAIYQGVDIRHAQSVEIYDLESGRKRIIQAADGERVRPGLFLNEDYVYGLAKEGDLSADDKGRPLLGCYSLEVQNSTGEVVSRYQKDGIFIGNWLVEDHAITLKGYQKVDGYYVQTTEDHIINNAGKEDREIKLQQSDKGSWKLLFEGKSADKTEQMTISVQQGKGLLGIPLKVSTAQAGYLVFSKGNLVDRTTDAGSALRQADAGQGRIETENRRLFWQRGELRPLGRVLETDDLPKEELRAALAAVDRSGATNAGILDASGADIGSLYNFLSDGKAIATVNSQHEAVLLYGYDLQGVHVLKLSDQSTETYPYAKVTQALGGEDRLWLIQIGK
ncbi:MAG: hypothetical protein SPL15_07770 [Lachnospiraceae bacterium]|nr:hypothetical protein [Lachnospiraceae bacterium]MDY5742871.1 hypothetical protein [Lachnospiraceae bacterium]